MKRTLNWKLGLALVAGAALVGCKTTGTSGAMADAPKVAAKADFRNETGANGLLSPRAIVARFVDALGGETAIKAKTAMTMKGSMELAAMGMNGALVLHSAAPNKMVMEVEMGGFGKMNNGFNGEHGWSDNPMTGPQLLSGDMLNQTRKQADFYAPLNYGTTYPTQETVEKTTYNGEEAYKVRLTDADGTESTQYFSTESALLIGTVGKQKSEMGEMEVETVLADYQDFGGLKVPTKTTLKMMGMEIVQKVQEVSYDAVPESIFAPPAAIQKLIDQ